MCCYDPNKRPSCAAALDHPYFKEHPTPAKNAFDTGGRGEDYPSRKIQSIEKKEGGVDGGGGGGGGGGAGAGNSVAGGGGENRGVKRPHPDASKAYGGVPLRK